jgi:hypothetical protein
MLLITVKYSREVDATDEDIERTRADLRARLRQLQELQGDEEDGEITCMHSQRLGWKQSTLACFAPCRLSCASLIGTVER